jgi:hypothetical protein
MQAAVALAPEAKRETVLGQQRLGHFILLCVRTTIHVKRWYLLSQVLRSPQTGEAERQATLGRMLELARAEIDNARAAIPLVEADSRLGWEPSMEYMTDREHLEWKIAKVTRVIEEAIPAFERTVAAPA